MARARTKPVLPEFPAPDPEFTFNQGFRPGLSDNPPFLGSKPIPEGKPGCLEGITFVATGTMPSITREDLKKIIEKYGGRLTGSISGRTDVVIRGCIEVGPSKLAQAKSKGLPIIDEDGLLHVIRASNPDAQPAAPPVIEGGEPLGYEYFPSSSLLTEKYRPRLLADVTGNLAPIKHLIKWFGEFESGEGKRAALLSGPPGVGKSTCAALCAKYCGYDAVEVNASDARTKKAIGDDVMDAFSNKSLRQDRACLIFDEVDGMSGGLTELVKLIQETKVPVVCICNDRGNRKLTTLGKYAVDISFKAPPAQSIADRLRVIADAEGIKVSDEQLKEVAVASRGDMRHAINTLQFWVGVDASESLSAKEADGTVEVIVDALDAVQRLYNPNTDFETKFDCFFADYGMVPLYAVENLPFHNEHAWFEAMDSFSLGDTVEQAIRGDSAWNLLPADAVLSAVLPATVCPMPGLSMNMRFPQWFGRNSKQTKLARYYREIAVRAVKTIACPAGEFYSSVVPLLAAKFTWMLATQKDAQMLLDSLDAMQLTLEDYEHVFELVEFVEDPKAKPKSGIAPGMKARVTRGYKQRHYDSGKTTIAKASEVHEDYYIISMPKKKGGGRSQASEDESSDGEIVRKPKRKSTKKKQKWSSESDDDGSDMDGFVVDDDVIEYEKAPKAKGSKKETTEKKPRGRPKKDQTDTEVKEKRPRGRPRKTEATEEKEKKPRGRPKKTE